MDKMKESEKNPKVQYLAEHFSVVLSPMEPTIMKLQSLLVWEKPVKSTVMMAVVHAIFWFFMYGGCRFYSTLSTILMTAFFLRTWKKKIWPEIRVPPKSPDTDDWTPVHPRLLSVPELCQHLALIWCYVEHCFCYWSTMRQDRPFKFCIETSFIFASLAALGHYISGGMLSYIIIMSAIMWPCLQYHNLLKKLYMKFEPMFMKLDYSMKVKNKWRYEGEKAPVSTNENTDEEGKLTSSVCADNESDLEDFYPSDPMISAALARAITDSEDEGGTPSVSLTPRISKEQSSTNSDDENQHTEKDIDDEFALSIDVMPSFEDTLDHTDDELLDLPSLPQASQSRESSEESMRFEPTYFDDSEDDTQFKRREVKRSSRRKPEKEPVEVDPTSVAREVVAQAFSNIMGSMIQKSVLGTLQNMAGTSNTGTGSVHENQEHDILDSTDYAHGDPYDDRLATAYGDSDDDDDDETMGTSDRSRRDELADSTISEDASSLNIEEEFDFLDEYDYGSSVEKK